VVQEVPKVQQKAAEGQKAHQNKVV
jgi:hypothetical protein